MRVRPALAVDKPSGLPGAAAAAAAAAPGDSEEAKGHPRRALLGWAHAFLAGLHAAYGSRLVRLLYLNAIFMALYLTQDMAYRDLPVWVVGGGGGAPQAELGGLIGSKYAGLRTLRGAHGPGCITGAGAGVAGARLVPGDANLTFNIIMTSNGDRPTLQPMLLSILPQLRTEDYFTLISDPPSHLTVAETFANTPCNCTKLLIQNSGKLGWWGHGSRTRWQKLLPGTFHMNADDDDLYLPNAMAIVRRWVTDLNRTMYVFRMVRRWDERIELIPPMSVNNHSLVRGGTVGTPCVVYRAERDRLPDWTGRYGGDGDFYLGLKRAMARLVVVPEVIYHVGQREDLLPYVPGLLRGELAEPEEDVLGRREWRKNNPEAPPRFLPEPTWAGTGTWCTALHCYMEEDPGSLVRRPTSWVPPEAAPQPWQVKVEALEAWHRQMDAADAAEAEARRQMGVVKRCELLRKLLKEEKVTALNEEEEGVCAEADAVTQRLAQAEAARKAAAEAAAAAAAAAAARAEAAAVAEAEAAAQALAAAEAAAEQARAQAAGPQQAAGKQ